MASGRCVMLGVASCLPVCRLTARRPCGLRSPGRYPQGAGRPRAAHSSSSMRPRPGTYVYQTFSILLMAARPYGAWSKCPIPFTWSGWTPRPVRSRCPAGEGLKKKVRLYEQKGCSGQSAEVSPPRAGSFGQSCEQTPSASGMTGTSSPISR